MGGNFNLKLFRNLKELRLVLSDHHESDTFRRIARQRFKRNPQDTRLEPWLEEEEVLSKAAFKKYFKRMKCEADDLIKIPNITIPKWKRIEMEDYPRRQGWGYRK